MGKTPIIVFAIVMSTVLGIGSWLYDPAHPFAYCLARFVIVTAVAALISAAVGLTALRFIKK